MICHVGVMPIMHLAFKLCVFTVCIFFELFLHLLQTQTVSELIEVSLVVGGLHSQWGGQLRVTHGGHILVEKVVVRAHGEPTDRPGGVNGNLLVWRTSLWDCC